MSASADSTSRSRSCGERRLFRRIDPSYPTAASDGTITPFQQVLLADAPGIVVAEESEQAVDDRLLPLALILHEARLNAAIHVFRSEPFQAQSLRNGLDWQGILDDG